MSKAFIDTTILADRLLKPGTKQEAAKTALGRYEETVLPVYAIKEFRAGAFRGFIWAHNKLIEKGNFRDFVTAASALRQRNLSSTALEAFSAGLALVPDVKLSVWRDKYGDDASPERIQFDSLRLQLRSLIYRAWLQRRKVTDRVVDELPCFQEIGPKEKRGLIEFEDKIKSCGTEPDCAVAKIMAHDKDALQALLDANDRPPDSAEKQRRRKGLRHLITHYPKRPLPEEHCRGLGDAVFAFSAPEDFVILTTNEKDHSVLAGALGKKVQTP